MKNALIIGLGDVCSGDEALGCYALEALSKEPWTAPVRIAYLGDDPRWSGGLIYLNDLVIIVGTLDLGGLAGQIHAWTYPVFVQHAAWLGRRHQRIRSLLDVFVRVEMANGIPKEVFFLWVQPAVTEGYGMSPPLRKAVWKTVQTVKQRLSDRGFLSRKAMSVLPFLSAERLTLRSNPQERR